MSHVFISYSTRNAKYAYKLRDKLIAEGFKVWIDNERLRSSNDWWEKIVLALRSCTACIVILTPESDSSRWVQREITLAEKYGKPILPLLLSGDLNTPNWEIFVRTQVENVKRGKLPSPTFFDMLAEYANRHNGEGVDVTTAPPSLGGEIREDAELHKEISNPPSLDKDENPPLLWLFLTKPFRLIISMGLGLLSILIVILLSIQNFNNSRSTPTPTLSLSLTSPIDNFEILPTYIPTYPSAINCSMNLIGQINQLAYDVRSESFNTDIEPYNPCQRTQTLNGALGVFLAASPDGNQTALFLVRSNQQVEVVPLATKSNDSIAYPAISPDGSKVAYLQDTSFGSELRMIDLNTRDEQILFKSSSEGFIGLYPITWSPNGETILFTVEEHGIPSVYWVDTTQFNPSFGTFIVGAHSPASSWISANILIAVIYDQEIFVTLVDPDTLKQAPPDGLSDILTEIENSLMPITPLDNCSQVAQPLFSAGDERALFYFCDTQNNYPSLRIYMHQETPTFIRLNFPPFPVEYPGNSDIQNIVYDVLPGWYITYGDGNHIYIASMEEPRMMDSITVYAETELDFWSGEGLEAWRDWKILYLDWANFPVT